MSWGEQKYNETFESATEGFTIVHTYKTPGYFTVKGDISYDGIRQLVKRNMIVCYRVEDSLLRFDNSSNIIRIGENSYIVSVKTDVLTADYDVAWKGFDEADPSPASNCSVFGFEVPIIGETILNATLSSPAGIMTYVEMATTAYGFFPVIMDITNLIIQYSVVNYTLDLIVQGSCGDLSQSVILQFEEPVKELRLKVRFQNNQIKINFDSNLNII